MENGPEMTSQEPTPVSPADEVVVEDVSITDSIVADVEPADSSEASTPELSSPDVVTNDVPVPPINGEPDATTETASETAKFDVQEAPAPQAVELFDLGDDLPMPTTVPAFDMAEQNVEPTGSDDIDDEAVIDTTNDVVDTNASQAAETLKASIPSQESSSADEEIFEQVMGSSRVDDIPVVRRSTPGSIPLPPQLAEEQARREGTVTPSPADPRGRRHPLPETGRTSRRSANAAPTAANPPQPTATPAADVICPKCQRTTSTRFTFCMKCGTDFPAGYVASLTGHHPQPSTPGGRGGVRDTRTTVRQINRIHEGRGNGAAGSGAGSAQTSGQEEWTRVQSGLSNNPFLVAFLSFLMPGLGHMMMGEHKKGLPWLFAGIAAMAFLPSWSFTIWIPLFLRIFSAINAYQLSIIKQDEQRGAFDTDDDA